MSDGLDATTVTADLHDFTRSLARFRSNVPGYKEDLTGYPNSVQDRRHPADLIADLRGGLRSQADQLQRNVGCDLGDERGALTRQATTTQRSLFPRPGRPPLGSGRPCRVRAGAKPRKPPAQDRSTPPPPGGSILECEVSGAPGRDAHRSRPRQTINRRSACLPFTEGLHPYLRLVSKDWRGREACFERNDPGGRGGSRWHFLAVVGCSGVRSDRLIMGGHR
jgi:hypothetical protein